MIRIGCKGLVGLMAGARRVMRVVRRGAVLWARNHYLYVAEQHLFLSEDMPGADNQVYSDTDWNVTVDYEELGEILAPPRMVVSPTTVEIDAAGDSEACLEVRYSGEWEVK